jgi:hypothetical protein
MHGLNRLIRVEIEVSEALLRRLQVLAGCSNRRRLDALASQLLIQALEQRNS